MRAYDLERWRALPLLDAMRAETFREVTAGAHVQRVPAGAIPLREGDAVEFLYVLLEGQIELHGSWNGQETVICVLRPGSTFTLAAIVLEAPALMSARALDESALLLIPADAIRKAMIDDAQFGAAVSRDLALGFRSMVRTIKNQKLRGGVERLANYLIMLRATELDTGKSATLPHEKRILASLLGMTAENLSRAFAALRAFGVSVSGSSVTIGNLAALHDLAKPDPPIDNFRT